MSGNGTVDFAGQCGECSNRGAYYSASSTAGMAPGQSASVNGSPPQNCVLANDGAKVFNIEVQKIAGIYSYQIRIEAQGPSGPFSGSMYLAFEDLTGDVYYIYIYSSTREWHYVSYNSDNPAIKTIYWSDYSFTVATGDANRAKPEYKVESAVRGVSSMTEELVS